VLAVEPSLPEAISTIDDLYLTGLHLEQYRHATRSPEPYWIEALRRDPSDLRSNHAMAKANLKRGEYALAGAHIRTAIARATKLNGNPYDGEIFYTLGLILRRLDKLDEAYAAFYKSTWNAAWRSAGYHAVAEIDAVRGDIHLAIEHLELSLKTNADNLNARNLLATLLLKAGKEDAAHDILAYTSDLDRLDLWSRFLDGVPLPENGHQLLALGLQMERAGAVEEAIDVFKSGLEAPNEGAAPLLHLAISRCSKRLGDQPAADRHLQAAADASPDLCFPSNLDQFGLLEYGSALLPQAARFHHYLGNFLYHKRRHEEAIQQWELAASLDAFYAQTWRNLGIAYFNIRRDGSAAQIAFGRALATAPHDVRLLYESDQLQKRLRSAPAARLKHLLSKPSMVESRDDLSVELASLFNQTGQPAEALKIILSRQFQPWEGGEGLVLAQYTEAHLELGKAALATGRLDDAVDHFTQALLPPASLGEARHLLANNSHIYYWLGEALAARKEHDQAVAMYERSAAQLADFQAMAVQPFSEMTYWSGLSLKRLGREQQANELFASMRRYAEELEQQTAKIDYFATSLPTLLLFEEDLDARLKTHARLLRSIALSGLVEHAQASSLIEQVLQDDPNNLFAIHFAEQTRTPHVAHAGSTG
jgi:tetratricopeptide (TPR) repeat protein